MKVKDIAAVVEQIAPLGLAQSWDNVGLLVGDRERELKNVLLTIDVTKAVVAEARKLKAELILSYHPVIWDGLKQVLADGPTRVVYELIRSNIAVFSIHTALDVVPLFERSQAILIVTRNGTGSPPKSRTLPAAISSASRSRDFLPSSPMVFRRSSSEGSANRLWMRDRGASSILPPPSVILR